MPLPRAGSKSDPVSHLVPAASLLERLNRAASVQAAIALFEAGFWRLPAFPGEALLAAAAAAYAAAGRAHAAMLLGGLAQQLQPPSRPASPGPAAAILADQHPNTALLHRLVGFDDAPDPDQAMALFEAALPHLRRLDEYWAYFRMAAQYEDAGRQDAAFLLASIALQMEPTSRTSHRPARLVGRRLLALHAWPEAASLHGGWDVLHPDLPLLDADSLAELALHAVIEAPAAPGGRRDRVVVPAGERPRLHLRLAGRALPPALGSLLQPEPRPEVTVAELEDAELLIADGAVAVWAADGTPLADLSVGMSPGLVSDLLRSRKQQGAAIVERELDRAVLIGDVFPAPNLCHFMLDQATRLAVYAQAGLDVGECVVIGPDLARPYQREIASRLGARRYMGTAGVGRVRVRRLAVASNCHDLRHSAHLGADWALGAVRAGFADVTAAVAPHRRLLVSRADAGGRRLVDEDAALALLQPHGFERIVPGTLSVSDQVRAFAAATHVVAVHGAALANLAFCRPGTHVLEIFHPRYGTYAYAMVAPTLALDYAAMLGFDGSSDAAGDNDPAMPATRGSASLTLDVRADIPRLLEWLATIVYDGTQA